jgi:hypothetical protein
MTREEWVEFVNRKQELSNEYVAQVALRCDTARKLITEICALRSAAEALEGALIAEHPDLESTVKGIRALCEEADAKATAELLSEAETEATAKRKAMS